MQYPSKVLVVGETIIDKYIYVKTIGMSPNEGIHKVKYLSEESFDGGILAVANHIKGFCNDVTVITGHKNMKARYVDGDRKLFGVSYIDDTEPEINIDVKGYDIVVVVDYGHGLIDADTVSKLCEAKFLALNVQTNTDNFGFNLITKYPRADYLCQNELEIRLACRDNNGRLEELVEMLSDKLNCNKIIVTRGKEDTLVYDGKFYYIPIVATEVKDVTGAGDAFFAVTSLYAPSKPMKEVGRIGNAVGSWKVQNICNRNSINPEELRGVL